MADSTVVPSEVTVDLRRILADAGISDNADLVARILATGIGLGMDGADRLDLRQSGLKFDDLEFVKADVDGDGYKDDVFTITDHGNIGLLDTDVAAINASYFLV